MRVFQWILWAVSAPTFVVLCVFMLIFLWSLLVPGSGGINSSDILETGLFAAGGAIVLLSPYYAIGVLKGVFGLGMEFRYYFYVIIGLVLISIVWVRYFVWGIVEPGVEGLISVSVFISISAVAALIFDRLMPVH